VHTTEGRADSVVFTHTHIFVFEFKINQTAEAALQQIINKHYAQKYENSGKTVVWIGANFDTKTKTMERWAMG
jgi:PD-(D/E)XK nuclease superfamily